MDKIGFCLVVVGISLIVLAPLLGFVDEARKSGEASRRFLANQVDRPTWEKACRRAEEEGWATIQWGWIIAVIMLITAMAILF